MRTYSVQSLGSAMYCLYSLYSLKFGGKGCHLARWQPTSFHLWTLNIY